MLINMNIYTITDYVESTIIRVEINDNVDCYDVSTPDYDDSKPLGFVGCIALLTTLYTSLT